MAYFCGLTTCFLCDAKETLRRDLPSYWRAIKAESRVYYVCPECLPNVIYSQDIWADFYSDLIKKIYDRDFKRPIRKILLMRDIGGNAEIINPNLN